MTELLIGTKKGLFVLEGEPGAEFEVTARAFAGEPVDYAMRESWRQGNKGLVARYLPDEAPEASTALCIHHLERAPGQPERLFMQFHGGVYRSDDAGEAWVEIGAGLPSDFGFPLAVDPADPDSAYVIPLQADTDRVTPDGRVRVFETRDAGGTWTARGAGLPQGDAYLTVLRQAFNRVGERGSLELYFGATTGEVFGSKDAGASWFTVASHLPPVYSLTASRGSITT